MYYINKTKKKSEILETFKYAGGSKGLSYFLFMYINSSRFHSVLLNMLFDYE